MTKVYVAHYALQSDLEAELDDPSLAEGGLEGLASPQVSAVLASPDGRGLQDLCRHIGAEYRQSIDEDGPGPSLDWIPTGHGVPSMDGSKVEYWTWELRDVSSSRDFAVALLVIQTREVES